MTLRFRSRLAVPAGRRCPCCGGAVEPERQPAEDARATVTAKLAEMRDRLVFARPDLAGLGCWDEDADDL